MRGKPAARAYQLLDVRITPAHAGKTVPGELVDYAASDHPRACGENSKAG